MFTARLSLPKNTVFVQKFNGSNTIKICSKIWEKYYELILLESFDEIKSHHCVWSRGDTRGETLELKFLEIGK